MRLRNGRTADQPVDADGTARCSRCHASVPVRADGSCDLGHRVTSAEHVVATAAGATAETAAGLEDPDAAETVGADESDLIRDAFGADTFGEVAPGASVFDDAFEARTVREPPAPGGGASPLEEVLPARQETAEEPTTAPRPAAERTAVALDELLDFGSAAGPSALDDLGHSS